jgi:hypothetical protein
MVVTDAFLHSRQHFSEAVTITSPNRLHITRVRNSIPMGTISESEECQQPVSMLTETCIKATHELLYLNGSVSNRAKAG